MLARWLGLAAVIAAVPFATGCAGAGVSGASEATGGPLTVYSSLPLQGPTAAVSRQIVNGEKLALSQAGGHVGSLKVAYVSLDDANPATGLPTPGVTAGDAKTAAQDTSTIAYLGDYSSAATAVSLPLINAAGILQVSPGSPYVGLTSSLDAGQDEPERFYPSGRRTFGRLQPGDPVQAAAQVQLMRSLGVGRLYVIDDQDPFEMPLATLAASGAAKAGITVAAHDSLPATQGATFKGEVEKVTASGADAVLFVGGGLGAPALWRELHAADPHLLLLGTSTLDNEAFTSQLDTAADNTYLTSPYLEAGLYPPASRRVLAAYREAFGSMGGAPALYGYEAMSVVLASIRAAGARGNDRLAVIERFFATRNRDSVLGRYSVLSNGETTLSHYAVDRVRDGRPVFDRALSLPGTTAAAGG